MAFSVQEFRSTLQYDGARPNLFQVSMTFPTLTTTSALLTGQASGVGASHKFSFMCKTAQLPGSTVNMVSVFYFGRQLSFAGNRTFPEWTVTIINDEDFVIRNAFEKWLNGLNSHAGNRRDPNFANAANYQVDGFVTQYNKEGIPSEGIKKYRFVGMFPVDISPIDLDWGNNDTIEEYAVTFAYQWWESDTTDSSATI